MSQEFASMIHATPASSHPVNLRVPPSVSKDPTPFPVLRQEVEYPLDGAKSMRRRLADGSTPQKSIKQTPTFPTPVELHANHVPRPRLLEKLSVECSLTRIVAPAGYGKSTVVAEWLNQTKRPHVWLVLESSDNSPIHFGKHFLQALSQLFAGLGFHFFSTMAYTTPRTLLRSVITLWEELGVLIDRQKMAEPAVLVIDNYQMLQDARIHGCVSEILRNLPPYLRVILISRSEPLLDKECLQTLSHTTLGSRELAFNREETTELLKKSVGHSQNSFNATEINELLLGWVAGLHLLVKQSEGHKNSVEELLFLKNSDLVTSHLMIETFYSAQPTLQLFMLCTSLFSYFTADLCESLFAGDLHSLIFGDEVISEEGAESHSLPSVLEMTEQRDAPPNQSSPYGSAQAIIEHLEKSGQFIMRCPGRKGWYQYHPLFARMLRMELQRQYPSLELMLRDRSQIWYLRNEGKHTR